MTCRRRQGPRRTGTWGRKCVREVSEKEGRREERRETWEGCEGGVHGADLSVDSAKMSRLRCGNVFSAG